jgi:hypothetical protein
MDSSQEKSKEIDQTNSFSAVAPRVKKRAPSKSISSIRLGLRFLLGSVLLINDEAQKRFAKTQEETTPSPTQRKVILARETSSDRQRYALVGLMVEGDKAVERELTRLGRFVNRSFRRTKRAIKPVTDNTIVRPINRRYDQSVQRGESILKGLIESGRLEEYRSRILAQKATTDTIEEVLDYLAESPEMDQLVDAEKGEILDESIEDVKGDVKRTGRRLRRWFQQNFNPESNKRSARKQNPSKPG